MASRGEREDQMDRGTFDRGSTFDRGADRMGETDTSNPPIIRANDPARGVAASDLAAGRDRSPEVVDQKLVAVWDAQGNPQVALVVNNQQQEAFRTPTKDEWDALRARGSFARGGLSGDTPTDITPAPSTPLVTPDTWKKVAFVGAVVGGVVVYKNWDTIKGWFESLSKEQGEDEVL